MKGRTIAAILALFVLPAFAHGQTPARTSLRDQLMPANVVTMNAPANVTEHTAMQPMAIKHSSGAGEMIAGAALFVAGLIVGGSAGTVLLLAGAGIGAYGLYLHFR